MIDGVDWKSLVLMVGLGCLTVGACDAEEDEASTSAATLTTAGASDQAPLLGGTCEVDSDCASGHCWDFNDYDPYCYGTVCTVECTSDADCIEAVSNTDAYLPERAQCGDDGLCDVVSTGLGRFVCD